MDYLEYLQDYFSGYTVTDEANFSYSGSGTVLLLKYLGGGSYYLDSEIRPIQIVAHTDDISTAKTLLSTFASAKSGTLIQEETDYVKQNFSTEVTLSTFQSSGANHFSQVTVQGTLIISSNISDIKTVEIDGFEYFTVTRKLSYTTREDSSGKGDGYLNESQIRSGLLQFACSMENKNNDVCVKARRIRQGILDINTTFSIKLTYSDNDYEETYSMKLSSYVVDSQNALTPVISLTFTR